METAEKNKGSMSTPMNANKKLTVVKDTSKKTTSFNPDYQSYNDNCNLNYWGAGFMGKDLMF